MPTDTINKQPARERRKPRPQLDFTYRTWGGRRSGAGRKKKPGSGVSHLKRPQLASRWPVHITIKFKKDLPGLRKRRLARIVQLCVLLANATGVFRIIHFAILAHHLHLIVEAKNREALSRGMQGLGVRLAKRLNKEVDRKGRVLEDRYHSHILKTPREVRNALCYLLRNNARHEAARSTDRVAGVDPYSSGMYFDGWRGYKPKPRAGPDPPPVAALAVGARRPQPACRRSLVAWSRAPYSMDQHHAMVALAGSPRRPLCQRHGRQAGAPSGSPVLPWQDLPS